MLRNPKKVQFLGRCLLLPDAGGVNKRNLKNVRGNYETIGYIALFFKFREHFAFILGSSSFNKKMVTLQFAFRISPTYIDIFEFVGNNILQRKYTK